MLRNKCPSGVSLRGDFSRTFLGIALRKNIKILYNINRRYEQAGHASGGPFFSALPEKKGEKRGAGYVWCVLRVRLRWFLIFSCYEHTNSPYGRYTARRLLRYNRFVSSCDLISAVKTPCVRNLQGSTDSPEFCRGRCPHRPAGKLRICHRFP